MRQSSRNLCKSRAYNSASDDVSPRHARASASVVRVAVTARSPIWSGSPSTTKPRTLASTASAASVARAATRRQQSTSRAAETGDGAPFLFGVVASRRPGDLGVDGPLFWGVPIEIRGGAPPCAAFLSTSCATCAATSLRAAASAVAVSELPRRWPALARALRAKPTQCSPRALTARTSAPPFKQALTVSTAASFRSNRCSKLSPSTTSTPSLRRPAPK
mmetsp:Transcript_20079/g.59875  ORF Transcript_20079/g.59875 Transcript_20079/m.59875 type:complete len:219 (+) Transcript_20079:594-1250(+)